MAPEGTRPTRAELLQQLQRAAREVLAEDAPELTEDFALGTGEIDSLDLVEILVEVEESLDLQFDADDFDGVTEVRDAIDLILRKCDAKAAAVAASGG